MKLPNRIISYLLVSLSCFSLNFAQWKLISGPEGGWTNFTFLGSKMYAGTANLSAGSKNLSLTTDQGASWIGLDFNRDVRCITFSADSSDTTNADLFIGTRQHGIFRSTDFGMSYFPSNSGISDPYVPVNAFLPVSDDTGDRILFVGLGFLSGIYRSNDNGISWTRSDSGITAPDIRAFTSIDSLMFAGTTYDGVYLSTDWGFHWSPANVGIENTQVHSFASRPINGGAGGWYLYAATDHGLYFTTNMGSSWSITSSLPAMNYVNSVGISSDSSYTIVAGTNSDGFYRSTNNGASWEPINNGLPTHRPLTAGPVAFNSTPNGLNLFASAVLIYKSTDNGSTWQPVSSGLSNTTVFSIAKAPDGMGSEVLLAGTDSYAIFRSPNGGKSWYRAMTGPVSGFFIYDFANTNSTPSGSPAYIFAAAGYTSPGVFRSSDYGISWNYVNSGLPFEAEVRSLAVIEPTVVSEPTRVFAGTYAGVYVTTNFGATWNESDSGLTNKFVRSLVSYKTNMFVATDGGVFKSTNFGTSWIPADSGLSMPGASYLAISPPLGCSNNFTVWAGGGTNMYRSTNNGDDWSDIVSPIVPGSSLVSLDPYNSHGGNYIFASGLPFAPSLYVTSDFGATWDSVGTGIASPNSVTGMVDVGDDLLASAGIGVWRRPSSEMITRAVGFDISTKKGWNIVSIPVLANDSSSASIFPCASSPTYGYEGIDYVTKDYLSHGQGYWARFSEDHEFFVGGNPVAQETVDVRTGWNLVGSISSAIPVSEISSEPPGLTLSNFFAFDKFYHISDILIPGAGYWVKANQAGTLILSSSSNSILASRKVRIVSTSELPPPPPGDEGSVVKNQTPARFALMQNYPNPFNPTTTVRYELPYESNVTLKIYDVLGQLVSTLVDRIEPAGRNSIEWNAQNVGSGVYFYRFEAFNTSNASQRFADIKKMVVVK